VREDGLWLGSCGVAKENSVWVMKIEEAGECRVRITGKFTVGLNQIKCWVLSEFEQGTAVAGYSAFQQDSPCQRR
jgi:hypothetical protein